MGATRDDATETITSEIRQHPEEAVSLRASADSCAVSPRSQQLAYVLAVLALGGSLVCAVLRGAGAGAEDRCAPRPATGVAVR